MTELKRQIKPYPLGAHRESDCIRFSFVSRKENCGVILYDRSTGRKLKTMPFLPQERMGNVYCKYVQGIEADKVSYQFYQEDSIVPDAYARGFAGRHKYGRVREENDLKAVFLTGDFDWQGDKAPMLSYEKSLVYCMHVRGFTRHTSSGVANKGTFAGVIEKLPYLQSSGITTIELQPAYEFLELPSLRELKEEASYPGGEEDEQLKELRKLNYWGYKKGFYYAPKAAYAADEHGDFEFKTMVRELHKLGMEVVMQFYFPKEINRGEIAEILRFWVLEYHVDGFHLMGDDLPITLLAKDETLVNTKLWYYSFDTDGVYDKNEEPVYRNLGSYREDYLYTMRKFLKGDEDMLNTVLQQMRHIPAKMGRLHYLSNYYGFTLMDMVSHDYKHNDDNGEGNRDGNDYNCSWNCGEEGVTRKKKVMALRTKQLKNAMCMLMLSQSTPLIFMGDEFGNSQFGNNNPYCQDNKTTWLDWKDLEKNKELYSFWQLLVELRKKHPVLHPEKELRIMDYIACGYPDLSYHGHNAWRPGLENYNRHVGIMYCGKYAKKDRMNDDDFFYVAMNMHWEKHELALPKLPKGMQWKMAVATEEVQESSEMVKIPMQESKQRNDMTGGRFRDLVRTIPARSIVVFKSEVIEPEQNAGQRCANKKARSCESINDRTAF